MNNKKDNPFIGLGAGGHTKVIIETLQQLDASVHGLLTKDPDHNTSVNDIPVLGDDSKLGTLYNKGFRQIFVGIGMTQSEPLRMKLQKKCTSIGFDIPPIVHPSAVVADSVKLGRGVQVLPNATINTDSYIQKGTIVNTGCIVEHDCTIGPFAHIGPGSCLNGNVTVGSNTHIGSGATVIENTMIKSDITIGAQSLILQNIREPGTYVGVPAKRITEN